ncbi:MAG TPA: LysR family transcriptional regulator [Bordetella sp.]|nr:LysR family transcriptional regulator [Bordetella sp.]
MLKRYYMELRQLRYFLAVAEELSFTRAAALLHVSQPPVSRQIMLLEAEIGTQLFERSKQYVRLTTAGQHFYDQARALVAAAHAAVVSTRRVAAGQVGKISVGLGGTAAHVFPDTLALFRRHHPEVELVLNPLNLAYHQAALIEGRIDVGLVLLPMDSDELETRQLMRMRLLAALPAGHALAARRKLSLRDLANQDFIMVPWTKGRGFGRLTLQACRRAGFVPNVVQEAEPMESVLGMVAAGAGVALVPESMEHLYGSKIAYRPIKEDYAAADIAIAWRKGDGSPILRAFLACCPGRSAPRRRGARG